MQTLFYGSHVLGPEDRLPDEIRIIVRLVLKVLEGFPCGLAAAPLEGFPVLVEEGSLLHDRAALLFDQITRKIAQRIL